MKKSIHFLSALLISTLLSSQTVAYPMKLTPQDTQDPYVLMKLFGAAYSSIKEHYVEETDNKKISVKLFLTLGLSLALLIIIVIIFLINKKRRLEN